MSQDNDAYGEEKAAATFNHAREIVYLTVMEQGRYDRWQVDESVSVKLETYARLGAAGAWAGGAGSTRRRKAAGPVLGRAGQAAAAGRKRSRGAWARKEEGEEGEREEGEEEEGDGGVELQEGPQGLTPVAEATAYWRAGALEKQNGDRQRRILQQMLVELVPDNWLPEGKALGPGEAAKKAPRKGVRQGPERAARRQEREGKRQRGVGMRGVACEAERADCQADGQADDEEAEGDDSCAGCPSLVDGEVQVRLLCLPTGSGS